MSALAYTIGSAILCVLAYLFDAACGWMIIPGITLLLCVSKKEGAYRLSHVVCWGTIYWGVLYAPLAQVIIDHGQGTLRLAAYFFLLAYQLCILVVFFGVIRFVLPTRNSLGRLGVASIGICLYWLYVSLASFWIFGSITGFCTAIPLVPLVPYSISCRVISVIHPLIALNIPVLIATCLALMITFRQWMVIALISLVIVCAESMMPRASRQCDWYETIGVIVPQGDRLEPLSDRLQEIVISQQQLVTKHSKITTILLPESAVPYCVDQYPWIETLFDPEVTTIFGSFYSNKDSQTNRCFSSILIARDTRITKCYDKIKPLPFTEYVPKGWRVIKGLLTLFLNGKNEIEPVRPLQPSFIYLDHVGPVEPFICSDLFYDTPVLIRNNSQKIPLLFLVNDSWFLPLMMPALLRNYGKLIALMVGRPVIYVGYYYQLIISPDGEYKELLK